LGSFELKYPNITRFTEDYGWVEMGVSNPYVKAFVKAYDEGGTVWEGNDSYKDMDEALEALEQGIGEWFHEVIGE
jgi:hypothetical protein